MQRSHRWVFAAPAIVVLSLASCQRAKSTTTHVKPAVVEHIEGSEVSRLTLTPQAAQRLDIRNETVREMRVARSGTVRKVVPYAAVLYDAKGNTWVYASPQPLVFMRQSIVVDYIEGDMAVLSEGPPVGTVVVTVGGAELFGAEFEIGH